MRGHHSLLINILCLSELESLSLNLPSLSFIRPSKIDIWLRIYDRLRVELNVEWWYCLDYTLAAYQACLYWLEDIITVYPSTHSDCTLMLCNYWRGPQLARFTVTLQNTRPLMSAQPCEDKHIPNPVLILSLLLSMCQFQKWTRPLIKGKLSGASFAVSLHQVPSQTGFDQHSANSVIPSMLCNWWYYGYITASISHWLDWFVIVELALKPRRRHLALTRRKQRQIDR